ncbi:poly [ADP-ribose] polymerase 14-like isoform X1 [Paramuricea clavata]|uniref:Poly [ADP-ribose] polymerase 14-like isoform X1 n=1 Tax=Paramuricea clavata TaxID=317549 RepID=A0A6S7KM05_PARCT|nr:poly [ADP-ribose] polymerase 14-like isoform X1 [Paramuricea clavata]
MATELDLIKAIKQGDVDIVGKEERTILVSELPEGIPKNTIHIHFQRKKNNGGEVEDTVLLPGGKQAWVIFEDPKVAEKVVDIEQIIQGKRVRVELLKTETKATEWSVESATILVSDLPEGVTENRITMHFQKRKNGGGEVKKVQLSSDRKEATVTFDDPKVAEKVVDTEQIIQGKQVRVELLKTETQATERIVESATILVSGLPEGVTENRITMHFQKRRNGGGEVKKVQLSSDRKEATVTFDDPKGLLL